MIICSDLHDRPLYINPDLLERIEVTPDTQLVFVNGKRTYIKESPEELVERIVTFRQRTGVYRPVPILEENHIQADEVDEHKNTEK
jgi:flagellar protein FlbD